jgi:hypothetical protein
MREHKIAKIIDEMTRDHLESGILTAPTFYDFENSHKSFVVLYSIW